MLMQSNFYIYIYQLMKIKILLPKINQAKIEPINLYYNKTISINNNKTFSSHSNIFFLSISHFH
jgi:hypothetical protein